MNSPKDPSDAEGNSDKRENNIAAIDIGTNSFHLVVAKMGPKGNLSIIDTDKITTRWKKLNSYQYFRITWMNFLWYVSLL